MLTRKQKRKLEEFRQRVVKLENVGKGLSKSGSDIADSFVGKRKMVVSAPARPSKFYKTKRPVSFGFGGY